MMTHRLRESIEELHVFDCHEHLPGTRAAYEDRFGAGADLLDMLGIMQFSLHWGYSQELRRLSYEQLSAVLRRISGSSMLYVTTRAVRDIYGIDISSLDKRALEAASKAISEAYEVNGSQWQQKILREYANIDHVILDHNPNDLWLGDYDRSYYLAALNMDMFTCGYDRNLRTSWHLHIGSSAYDLEESLDMDVGDFDDYIRLVDLALGVSRNRNFVCLKNTLGKQSPSLGLDFEKVEQAEARRVFGRAADKLSLAEKKKFRDYMVHYMISKCEDYGLPVQFH